jgi:hypothetical protein
MRGEKSRVKDGHSTPPARETIFVSNGPSPTAVLAAALERLELASDGFAERASYLVGELQKHGYRIKRR